MKPMINTVFGLTIFLFAFPTNAGTIKDLANMEAVAAKNRAVESFRVMFSEAGKKISEDEARTVIEKSIKQLDEIALQKGKSCLYISNEWEEEQEKLFESEVARMKSGMDKDAFVANFKNVTRDGADYIKYKCLASSDFLNN